MCMVKKKQKIILGGWGGAGREEREKSKVALTAAMIWKAVTCMKIKILALMQAKD